MSETHTPEIRPAFRARVKPLEWEQETMGIPRCETAACAYRVRRGNGTYRLCIDFGDNHRDFFEGFSDALEAMEYAQRDHDSRVRALLIIEEDHDTDR